MLSVGIPVHLNGSYSAGAATPEAHNFSQDLPSFPKIVQWFAVQKHS